MISSQSWSIWPPLTTGTCTQVCLTSTKPPSSSITCLLKLRVVTKVILLSFGSMAVLDAHLCWPSCKSMDLGWWMMEMWHSMRTNTLGTLTLTCFTSRCPLVLGSLTATRPRDPLTTAPLLIPTLLSKTWLLWETGSTDSQSTRARSFISPVSPTQEFMYHFSSIKSISSTKMLKSQSTWKVWW